MKHLTNILLFIILIACNSTDKKSEVQHEKPIDKYDLRDEWRLYTDDGTSLFVREFGRGDTVLVLHGGWGAEHSYLIDPFIKLANNYHFIFYDQRGSLRSQCPDSLISVDNHIKDVERIRKATGQDKLLIIGHSMGGFLGMSYMDKYPDRVNGLLLIASAPAKGNVENLTKNIQEPALKRWTRQEVIDTLEANGLDEEIQDYYTDKQRGTWHRITFAALNLHHIKNWRKVKSAFFHNGKSASIAATSGPHEWNFIEALQNANFPITAIHGDDDYLPLKYQKEWIPGVPSSELIVINNAGHLCWIDKPIKFEDEVRKALNKYKK